MKSAYIAGDPEHSLLQYTDANVAHDHTYYGINGCPNSWGDDGKGGSDVPCTTNQATTFDNEVQNIGTFYHFQAATSGSGGAIVTPNANSPDTFCPLGWQLPYGGTGGDYYNQPKSWNYLISTYGFTIYTDNQHHNNQSAADLFKSYPMSYILAGNYRWDRGRLYYGNVSGPYWYSTAFDAGSMYRYVISNMGYNNADLNSKTYGQPMRCDRRISILKSSPWHPRSLISIMAFHFLKAHFPSVKIMSNYLKNETKYFIFMELRANFDEAESKYKMENRILMSELQDARDKDASDQMCYN